jgi:signal transduction histidine kinase
VTRIRGEVDASVEAGSYAGLQFRTVTPDGELRWLMTAGRVERDGAGAVTGLAGCLLDITERRRLEDHLEQVQRMEAVGQLAAGVAHNFNNLLAAILPALELATRRAPETEELLADVREAAERSADVVRQLMAFAGGGALPGPSQPCDVGMVARRVVKLARAMLDPRIALAVDAPDEVVLAPADGGELEHEIMNLLLNPRDAVLADPVRARAPMIQVQVRALPGGAAGTGGQAWAEVRVVDNGVGMTDAVRRRAVEPFFTTKPPGRGTGLGLASAFAMARARGGGRLVVDSTPGRGTTVTIELPVVASAAAASALAPAARRGRGEHVLVVDDEPAVLRAVASVLRDDGYEVSERAAPHEALELFAAAPERYGVVVFDTSMPSMGGHAVLARMRAVKPDVRVISFSGLEHPLAGARAHLRKPVGIEQLVSAVRRVIDEP